jgi:signal transduction histidine kinase
MKKSARTFKTIPGTTLRRLRNTPSYFFLIWRWTMWFFALIWIVAVANHYTPAQTQLAILLLTVTFIQSLVVTLYAPVFQIFFPWLPGKSSFLSSRKRAPRFQRKRRPIMSGFHRPQPLAEDEDADILTPLAQTLNPYWDIGIYALDVIICGLVTYFGGALSSNEPFGNGSPFYRYGFSAAFAAAFAYRYPGALAASFGYDLFILLGLLVSPPGAAHYTVNAIDLEGSLIDVPLSAILAAYLATLLSSYTKTKRELQDNARRQQALVRVGETLMREASNREHLLQQSVAQIRQGGHFQRLVIGLIDNTSDDEDNKDAEPVISTYVESDVSDIESNRSKTLLTQVILQGQKLNSFEPLKDNQNGYGIARLYLPLFKDGRVQIALGAESRRQTPFAEKQEKFLTISGTQLLVALENIHLTEQMVQLAATAERGRIAREIHDGIAQLIYMLSISTETCAAYTHRIVEASEEDAELLTPLAERLDKLVTLSKQALWETRNYMFNLKPLMSGTLTLTEMLTNQLHEFEAISGLMTHLEVEGSEEAFLEDRRHARKYAQAGPAIFRIVQEALTNAYKHAHATQISVHLSYLPQRIEVEVCDNGQGLPPTYHSYSLEGESQRLYSGHGLRGMRERAEELGGTVEITSNAGVKVRACIPIA